MQTNFRPHVPPTTTTSTIPLYIGDGMRATGAEADFHAGRLLAEAVRDRAGGRRQGLRHRVGRAIIAIGRAIDGLEVERPAQRDQSRITDPCRAAGQIGSATNAAAQATPVARRTSPGRL